jgi:hypothetical protein
MRLSSERACVERLVGSLDPDAADLSEAPTRAPSTPASPARDRGHGHAIEVDVLSGKLRHGFRCTRR